MKITDLFKKNGLKSFLEAYHTLLHKNVSFPPYKGNKPMHLAAKVFDLGSMESLNSALEKELATLQAQEEQNDFLWVLTFSEKNRQDEFEVTDTSLYRTHEKAVKGIQNAIDSAMMNHDKDVDYIIDAYRIFESAGITDLSDFQEAEDDETKMEIAYSMLDDNDLIELYYLITGETEKCKLTQEHIND